jgi:hypothetical protein
LRRLLKIFFILFFVLLVSCKQDSFFAKYKTKNVVIVIVDGARYSETWGDPSHQNIPFFAGQLAKQGVVYTNFYNLGPTYTLAGHTCITTGYYQEIENTGKEFPKYPSIFQHYNQTYLKGKYLTWIVSSKDKLDVLSNCTDSAWRGRFLPNTNCGVNGAGTGSGFRSDTTTYKAAIDILGMYHPHLALISFMEPDYSAHSGNWTNYINGIKSMDEFSYKIWQFLQTDSIYKGTTTFIITNDHGRHLDTVADGFVNHGDGCEGCRHIELYVYGPDTKRGVTINTRREQKDLPVTIAELLQFQMTGRDGQVMREMLNDNK